MSAKIHFREYTPNQMLLFPLQLDKDIAPNDPVRVVNSVIDNLRLDNFKKLYNERGRSPYHPKMMLKAIIYGYMNNLYSCRKIEAALKRDIHFIWMAGYEQPDFNTINRFRNRVKDEINQVFTQLVLVLARKGFITLDVEYIDGTKIESKANKYTFVWRKTTEKNRARLMEKIRALLEQIDAVAAQENAESRGGQSFTPADLRNIAEELNKSLAETSGPTTKEEKKQQRERKRQVGQLRQQADKLEEYDRKLGIMGNRNSYAKTDEDATFMPMKEDAQSYGLTKPGYNLQIGTENQFILDFGLFSHPNDSPTLVPFLQSYLSRYGRLPSRSVADAGYGSEENYRFMEESGMEAYVKYNWFDREQQKNYAPSPFSAQALYYNAEYDYYICPMGQRMDRLDIIHSKTENGYVAELTRYQARNCEGCPLRGSCFRSEGNRIMEVNYRLNEYRKKARELLTSKEGRQYIRQRSIEPESVFGQMKYNMSYRRFRHIGKDKVTMDFAFFAIAFNLKKMCSKMAQKVKKGGKTPFFAVFGYIVGFAISENRIFWRKSQKSVA